MILSFTMSKLKVDNLETWMNWLLFVAKGTSKVITFKIMGFYLDLIFMLLIYLQGPQRQNVDEVSRAVFPKLF